MAAMNTVTLVITHNLQPNQATIYEAWLARIMPAAEKFPGHLGVHVIRPAAGSETYNIVIRFDTLDNLYTWINSDLRKELVAEIAPILAQEEHYEVRTEPEFWFTPSSPAVKKPKKWKQFLITLLVIFPSTNLVPNVTEILLPALKGTLSLHFINDACVVGLVVYLWMPLVTRIFAGWLKK
ncbi:MAG: antibiotic biosynthesis monooxygenase [Enterobacteriaceae bacterium]|jgi:antibiotic biosynthesis monooxygenase (ABM) superfamily enzyme|nr:antibiotic biosynthesis monooxygenase [Enterobacteriaceae bacterium]